MRQFGVGGISDVLLLHGGIHDHFLFPGLDPVHLRRDFENAVHASLADALAEIHQIAGIAGQLPLKFTHPADVLPVGILHPPRHHRLVALVEHLFEQQ